MDSGMPFEAIRKMGPGLPERRAESRRTVSQLVYFTTSAGLSAWGMMINVSRRGAFLLTHVSVSLGEEVSVDLMPSLGGEPLGSAGGKVRRLDGMGFGLEWTTVDPRALADLMGEDGAAG
jgi:hypothetical protein